MKKFKTKYFLKDLTNINVWLSKIFCQALSQDLLQIYAFIKNIINLKFSRLDLKMIINSDPMCLKFCLVGRLLQRRLKIIASLIGYI